MAKLKLLKFSNHIGVYDAINEKRLKDLIPKKEVEVNAKASMFEGGYRFYTIGDIHQKLRKRRFISKLEYNKLLKAGY